MTTKWDNDRYDELEALQRLVRLAGYLNTSTGIVGNIQELKQLSDRLQHSDLREDRLSFMQFLHDLAIESHHTQPESE